MNQLPITILWALKTASLRFALVVAVTLLPVILSGCSEKTIAVQHEHQHDHSHVHAKPVDFAETVKRVRREYRRILAALSREDLTHIQRELSHLTETIGTLPEVAADSDLLKADWERVKAVSQSLLAECVRLRSMKTQPPSSEVSSLDTALKELDEIAGKLSPPRKETN